MFGLAVGQHAEIIGKYCSLYFHCRYGGCVYNLFFDLYDKYFDDRDLALNKLNARSGENDTLADEIPELKERIAEIIILR